jgi:hypothetical protein
MNIIKQDDVKETVIREVETANRMTLNYPEHKFQWYEIAMAKISMISTLLIFSANGNTELSDWVDQQWSDCLDFRHE